MLAHYLLSSEHGKPPDFYVDKKQKAIILEGQYNFLRTLPQYIRGKKHDATSYSWDAFIEHFSTHALGGTLVYDKSLLLSDACLALKIMASERRGARRVLANSVIEKIRNTARDKRAVRIIASPSNPDNGYVWLAEPIPYQAKSHEEYREYRKSLLYVYCTSANLLFPGFKVIVGIATEQKGGGGGEDMIYLDTTHWQKKDFDQAEKDRAETGVLLPQNTTRFEGTDYQYPVLESDYVTSKIKKQTNRIAEKAKKQKNTEKGQKN